MADRRKGFQKGTIMAKIRANMLDEESVQDNWVDLAARPPSRDSTSSVAMCADPSLLVDAQKSAAISRHSFSPKSSQSPNVEFDTTLEAVKYKLARDILPPGRNTDWIWDWSSRPEASTSRYKISRTVVGPQIDGARMVQGILTKSQSRHQGYSQASSNLVTPPNSPIPSSGYHSMSLRHSKWLKKPWFSFEVISAWVLSNTVTFILGVCTGYFFVLRNRSQFRLGF